MCNSKNGLRLNYSSAICTRNIQSPKTEGTFQRAKIWGIFFIRNLVQFWPILFLMTEEVCEKNEAVGELYRWEFWRIVLESGCYFYKNGFRKPYDIYGVYRVRTHILNEVSWAPQLKQ